MTAKKWTEAEIRLQQAIDKAANFLWVVSPFLDQPKPGPVLANNLPKAIQAKDDLNSCIAEVEDGVSPEVLLLAKDTAYRCERLLEPWEGRALKTEKDECPPSAQAPTVHGVFRSHVFDPAPVKRAVPDPASARRTVALDSAPTVQSRRLGEEACPRGRKNDEELVRKVFRKLDKAEARMSKRLGCYGAGEDRAENCLDKAAKARLYAQDAQDFLEDAGSTKYLRELLSARIREFDEYADRVISETYFLGKTMPECWWHDRMTALLALYVEQAEALRKQDARRRSGQKADGK